MKRLSFFLIVLFLITLFSPKVSFSQNKDYSILERNKGTGLASFVKVNKPVRIQEFQEWFKKQFHLEDDFVLVLKNKSTDSFNFTHYRFNLYFQSEQVFGADLMVHVTNGLVDSFNGFYIPSLKESEASLSEKDALNNALSYVNANQYKWELPTEEKALQRDLDNPFASYYPNASLVYAPLNGLFKTNNYRLTYRFDIYAHAPISRQEIFIDAQTGEVVFVHDLIHIADQVGTGITGYSGTQTITAFSGNSGFTLEETGRGNGIGTYNMQNGTDYSAAVDFTDADNNWNYSNTDKFALDAHWGAEITYDYFLTKHSRNSIDGNGKSLISYVHYDVNFGNAYWDGNRMTYGDGSNGNNPYTTPKIAGHEIAHGLTQFTANLIYQDESGALNESFSDIFGRSIEAFGRPNNTDWILGNGLGFIMRDMSNPNVTNDPDTYQGTNWYTGTADNGGVHTNSGVLNYWYYLLTDGGSGTNDIGNNFSVTGIGLDDASKIAFRTLTVYLTSTSTYQDAYTYSIQSAEDIFGACSPELEATHNAWYAVGFGNGSTGAISAQFTQTISEGCAIPMNVTFSNNSSASSNFSWNFGDGNTSTAANPTHTYTTAGTYTVSLTVSSNACGSDNSTVVNAVTVGSLSNPTTTDVNMCAASSVDLTASANGNIEWYANSTGGPSIAQGSTFSTPVINTNTTYYVEQSIGGASQTVGPVNHTSVGNGGYFNGDQHLIFDCYTACTLNSVWVDVSGGGNRTIELRNSNGTVLQSTTVNIPNGQGRVNLNFNIPVGQNLQLGWTSTSQPNFYRNNDGSNYPYNLNGVISIKNSSANQPGYYYAFYDWDISSPLCTSARIPVNITVSQSPTTTDGSRCGTGTVNLTSTAYGSGTLNWYDALSGGNLVGTGTNFTTPNINTSTNYYVEEVLPMPTIIGGPTDNTFGTGGYFDGDQHLIFNCNTISILKSVKVYADAVGNRTIELRDNGGTVLQSLTVNIPAGESRVTLNFNLPIATNLQLGVTNGSAPGLWRNNGSASYPYNIGSLVEITETSAASQGVQNYYYFFYDWYVEEPACITARTLATATVNGSGDPTITPVSTQCISASPITLSVATSGGTWSGTGINSTGVFDPSIGIGTYTISYALSGSCTATDQIDIIVSAETDATITSGTTYCLGQGNVQLTAVDQGGIWSGDGITNSNDGTFNTNTAGIGLHTITYTTPGPCGDTNSVSVYVSQTGDASFTVLNSTVCENDASMTFSPNTSGGVWSGNGVNSSGTFTPSIAGVGTHTVTYTLSSGCSSTHSETITVTANANAAINYVGSICSDHAPITLTAATQGGTWIGPGITNNSNGTFDPTIAGVGAHDITYVITGNCGASATTSVIVDDCSFVNEKGEITLQAFPNPTRSNITIIVSNTQSLINEKLIIYNQLGEVMLSKTINPIANRFSETIDLSFLANGVYSIRIGGVNKKITKIN